MKTVQKNNRMSRLVSLSMMVMMLFAFTSLAQAAGPYRIVVAPYYTEEGVDVRAGGEKTLHYRRIMRYINNRLVKSGFEVVNPVATEYKEEEYNRMMERSRGDSVLASRTLCKKYGTDAAYVVWLKVKAQQVKEADGRVLYKGMAILEGEGYDSAGRDLGAGLAKDWTVTREDYDKMIVDVEKEVGYEVGRVLTAFDNRRNRNVVSSTPREVVSNTGRPVSNGNSGGVLQRNLQKNEQFINVYLEGPTQYETAEVFGKVVNTATGVVSAKRYGSEIINGNPQRSRVSWRVQIANTDPFRLQANIMTMIDKVINAGGEEFVMNGVPYRYNMAETELLKAITPHGSTSMEIRFNVDRDRLRDIEFMEPESNNKGFN